MSWPFSSCPLLLVSYLSKTASSHFCSLMYACVAWVQRRVGKRREGAMLSTRGLRGATDLRGAAAVLLRRCYGRGAAELRPTQA